MLPMAGESKAAGPKEKGKACSLRERTERGVHAASAWLNPLSPRSCSSAQKVRTSKRPERPRPCSKALGKRGFPEPKRLVRKCQKGTSRMAWGVQDRMDRILCAETVLKPSQV